MKWRSFLQNYLFVLLALGLSFLVPVSLLATPWPLGNIRLKSQTTLDCPQGYSCQTFDVKCRNVTNRASGELAVGSAYGASYGVLMFFTGGHGTGWWTNSGSEVYNLGESLRRIGFIVVQVKWKGPGWLVSSSGDDAGIAHLACRPATVINYVHENYYLPLGLRRTLGKAGFAITGNSGGASQVSYALSHYGLDEILDAVIPTGGPPHAVLAESCMDNPLKKAFWFSRSIRTFIDQGFGFFNGYGPCAVHDSLFIPRWKQESCATGGNDYYYPKTRVHFLIGGKDGQMRRIAKQYFSKLKNEGSPYLEWEIVPGTGHLVVQTEAGRLALKNAILATIQ